MSKKETFIYGGTTLTAVEQKFKRLDLRFSKNSVPFGVENGRLAEHPNLQFDGETLTVSKLGATELTGNMTATNRIIVPMGEINYFNTTGTAIAIALASDGSTNMVLCNPATTLNNDSGFDMPSNGRLRYTGAVTKMFHVACTISFAAAAANDVFVIGIAKNGTVIDSSKCIVRVINANDTASTALHVMAELATNQYLELYVGNITDADDFTIKTLTLFAMGM